MKYLPHLAASLACLPGLVVLLFVIGYSCLGASSDARYNRGRVELMGQAVNFVNHYIDTHGHLPTQQDINSALEEDSYEISSIAPSTDYPFPPWPRNPLNYAIGTWNGDNEDYFDSPSGRYTYQDSTWKVILGLWPGFTIGLFFTSAPWLIFLLKRNTNVRFWG